MVGKIEKPKVRKRPVKARSVTIQKQHKETLHNLVDLAKLGKVCLMVCRRRDNNQNVIVVCGITDLENGTHNIYPLAELYSGDPCDSLFPPDGLAQGFEGSVN